MNAVLFDLDGVLVDSELLWARLADEVLRAAGAPRSVFGPQYRSLPISQTFALVTKELGLDADPMELRDRLLERFRERISELSPVPGAVDAVTAIQRRWSTGLVTSTPRELALLELARTGLSFRTAVCGGEAERAKPAPEPYLLAAKRLGARPERCIVVEDSSNGIASGKAAGMRVIGLLGSHNARPELAAADVIAASASHLPRLVEELSNRH